MPTQQLNYDDAQIRANMAVLRTFGIDESRGRMATKLYVHQDGTFERMESGVRTAWKRTFGDRQQSLSDPFVLQAVYDLFEQAAPSVPRSNALAIAMGVAGEQRHLREYLDAFQGFTSLAVGYDKSPVPRFYASKILDGIVLPLLDSILRPAMRNAPDTTRLLAFNQGRLLDRDDAGKCFGFTMEWARRYVMSGKFSFTEHNPAGKGSYGQDRPPDEDPLSSLRYLDFRGWITKRMERIALMQKDQAYHERTTVTDPFSGETVTVAKKASLQRSVSPPALAPGLVDRNAEKVGTIKRVYLRDFRTFDPPWLALPSDVTGMCADMVRCAWDDLGTCGLTYAQQRVAAVNVRLATLRHEFPDRATPADESLMDIQVPPAVRANPQRVVRASYALHWNGNFVFPVQGKTSSGHTMGLHFHFPSGGVPRYVFFDPNFGEFEVSLHNQATPEVTIMAAIFSYYSATFELRRFWIDRMWEE